MDGGTEEDPDDMKKKRTTPRSISPRRQRDMVLPVTKRVWPSTYCDHMPRLKSPLHLDTKFQKGWNELDFENLGDKPAVSYHDIDDRKPDRRSKSGGYLKSGGYGSTGDSDDEDVDTARRMVETAMSLTSPRASMERDRASGWRNVLSRNSARRRSGRKQTESPFSY
ncbi:uncharacterized protein LOC144878797 isoform X2 [Branchiostoma floridae x Branchiostoma japonicum]